MRKLILSSFATLGLLLGLSATSFAQYQLYVSAPANLKGLVSGTGNPSNTSPTWGFGDPATIVPPICGQGVYATPDTFGVDTNANYTNLKGKVAVFFRGQSITFGQKAYCAQKGGAIACILIDHFNRGVVNMAPSDLGGKVFIPTILAPYAWGLAANDAIVAGTLNVCIGNPKGAYPNNLSLIPNVVAPPVPLNVPNFMVSNGKAGEIRFPIGAYIINSGNNAQAGVKFKAEVNRISPNPAQLWKDSALVGTMTASGTKGDTSFTNSFVGDFDFYKDIPELVAGSKDRTGHYRLTYAVKSDSKDSIPDDNIVNYDFYVTPGGQWSLSGLDAANNYKPIPSGGATTRVAGTGGVSDIKWGQVLKTGSAAVRIDSLTYATSTISGALAGEQVTIEVHEWDDANKDGSITDAELTLVGNATRGFTDDAEKGVFYTDVISDASTALDFVVLKPTTKYLVLWTYSGSTAVSVSTYRINYRQNLVADSANTGFNALNIPPDWSFFTGYDLIPAFKVTLSDPTAVKPSFVNAVGMHIFPNPATDHLQVNVTDAIATGKATIQISDLAGRVLLEEARALESGVSRYKLSTASLNNGVYNVRVSTPRGSKTQKLVITR